MRFTILKLKGNYKEALEVKETYDVLLDSLQKGKVQLDLAKLDLYNDVELSKLEISDLNKQQALSRANLENQKLIIIIIIVICIFVISMLILNYLKSRNLKKINSILNKQQKTITNQNEKLLKINEEKEVLIGEVHHRVKNSLQTISSLLNMQQRKLSDPAAVSAIKDSQKRVQVMGLLYKFVYQHDNFEQIALKPYMEQLVKMLMQSHQSDTETSIEILVCNIETNVDTTINLGLIINELIINSLKYAVSDGHILQIKLDITHSGKTLNIILSDNGIETSDNLPHQNAGFGWKLIQSLVEKAGGTLSSQYNKGLSVNMQIPLEDSVVTVYADET
jgi:two-component sensor histidine kinase